jgi:uncharacterized protein (DUF39 family)
LGDIFAHHIQEHSDLVYDVVKYTLVSHDTRSISVSDYEQDARSQTIFDERLTSDQVIAQRRAWPVHARRREKMCGTCRLGDAMTMKLSRINFHCSMKTIIQEFVV